MSKSCWEYFETPVAPSRVRSTLHKITKEYCQDLSASPSWSCEKQTTPHLGSRQLTAIMIMQLPILHICHRVSWPSTTLLYFVKFPILSTWLRVTSGFSPSWKCLWKGQYFGSENASCRMRQNYWTPSQSNIYIIYINLQIRGLHVSSTNHSL